MIGAWFESGRAVDAVLAFLALEALLLFVWLKHARRGRTGEMLLALLPGLCLLMALRAALAGSGWMLVALWLTASLPAHLIDLGLRLKR